MTKPSTPYKHHYMATVLPSIYYEYKTKEISVSSPSLKQDVTPPLRPDQKIQTLLQPDSVAENPLEYDQDAMVSHYQFNPYPTPKPITDHWFEDPLHPWFQDRDMVKPLTCQSHETENLLSHKPCFRKTHHLNHWYRAMVTSLPSLDHWYRATAMTASDMNPWGQHSDLIPSHSHLFSKSKTAPSLQANLYAKVTTPCSLCPYQWVKTTSPLSSQEKVMVIPSSNPQLQTGTKAMTSLGPGLPAKDKDLSPYLDNSGEFASTSPPCPYNTSEDLQESDKSKDIFGSSSSLIIS
ncbi:uncharacterized protein LOC103097598 [Monodelphis domestica]|uniref:uncharacterized protein LOC103097598 n=1 Tax=Monodelphis domestica TaxID=13616 RepID=UPI0004434C48|nr:uncharacterized protein LOC103097598 [Monodelphis domestica]